MSKPKSGLLNSVAITNEAYAALVRTSKITGLPLGLLASHAIERSMDPKRNSDLRQALAASRNQILESI